MEHPVVQLDGDRKNERRSFDYVMVFPLGNREDCDKLKSRLEQYGLRIKVE